MDSGSMLRNIFMIRPHRKKMQIGGNIRHLRRAAGTSHLVMLGRTHRRSSKSICQIENHFVAGTNPKTRFTTFVSESIM